MPKGTEVRPRRGVYLPDGTIETVPLGVLVIRSVDLSRPDGAVQLRVEDRAVLHTEDELEVPFAAGGMTSRAVIEALVVRTCTVAVAWSPLLTNPTLPAGTVFDGRASDAIQSVADGLGAEFYYDADGVPTVAPMPDLTTAAPVVVWTQGSNGVLVKRTDSPTRDGSYNAVRVIGSADSGPTPSGFASISVGEMRYGGPFGRRVSTVNAPNLTTNAACQTLANSLIGDGAGIPHTISLGVVPNPAIQAGDVITVTDADLYDDIYRDVYGGESFTHLIDRVVVGLSAANEMAVETRSLLITPEVA
jgi:hypothetical protein